MNQKWVTSLILFAMTPFLLFACYGSAQKDDRLVIRSKVSLKINSGARSFSLKAGKNSTHQVALVKLNKTLQHKSVRFVAPLVSKATRPAGMENYFSIVLKSGTSTVSRKELLKALGANSLINSAYVAPAGEEPGGSSSGSVEPGM